MTKTPHSFRFGDVVSWGNRRLYVVSGVKGWLHHPFKDEKGKYDTHISITRSMGNVSTLVRASQLTLKTRREDVGAEWWKVFPVRDNS